MFGAGAKIRRMSPVEEPGAACLSAPHAGGRALIASAYLSGTNARRVRRALVTLFSGAVVKDTVSRVWRKVKSDWEACNARPLAAEPIVRVILDGSARPQATTIS